MLNKSTHPFIVNTLESSPAWSLQTRKYPDAWEVTLWFDDEGLLMATSRAEGLTFPEALDRLESVLAGREYVEPSPTTDPEHEAYLARWKDAPADATHLAQDSDGKCWFYESEPILDSDQNWFGACALRDVADKLLGSVGCEPRPVQETAP